MSQHDMAYALADTFSHNSASAFSKKAEQQTMTFSSFSMEELQEDVLCKAHVTSTGPDVIHYQLVLLKHLPSSSLLLLLNIFNKIWISGVFPSDGRKAIVIPIPKPGKDPMKEGNVLFNDALNTFYLRLYGVGHMVMYYSDRERKPTASTWAALSD